MLNIIHRLTLPSVGLVTDLSLYVRLFDRGEYLFSEREIRFDRRSSVVFDTYFNSFSAGKWMRHTQLETLVLRVEVRGRFLLRWIENRPMSPPAIVAEKLAENDNMQWVELELPVERLAGGSLFLSAYCTSRDGVLRDACYATYNEPERLVRVGIVITTFNRKDYIRGNLARLRIAAGNDPIFKRMFHVVVVDNAENLVLESSEFLTYIKNRNLGGAGGFSRGLFELRRKGGFTHVLFMDDDIVFEMESIRRAAALVAYAKDRDCSIAGAMFLESVPTVQYEAGASFLFHCPKDPICKYGVNMDMARHEMVTQNDSYDYPVDYGAWWFFLFPIWLSESDLAFPLFLRGDDIIFGYKYAKKILTMNGICVWHMPFEYKDSPTSLYYSQRNFEVVRAVATPDEVGTATTLAFLLRTALIENLTYRYSSAAYRIRAFRDFLKGPEWWQTIDFPKLNEELRAGDDEKLTPLEVNPRFEGVDYYCTHHKRHRLRKIAQLMTLNGHLIPSWVHRRRKNARMRVFRVQERPMSGAFCQAAVMFWYEPANEGFVTKHSKKRFFKNLRDLAAVAFELLNNYQRVRQEFRAAYPKLVSEQAWGACFSRTQTPRLPESRIRTLDRRNTQAGRSGRIE